MTCSTSEVAVCCSSASVSSRVRACTSSNSRTFSIAITAWSAKVVTSSICLSVNGTHLLARHRMITPIGVPSRSSGTPSHGRIWHLLRLSKMCTPDRQKIRNMNRVALQQDAPASVPRPLAMGVVLTSSTNSWGIR